MLLIFSEMPRLSIVPPMLGRILNCPPWIETWSQSLPGKSSSAGSLLDQLGVNSRESQCGRQYLKSNFSPSRPQADDESLSE